MPTDARGLPEAFLERLRRIIPASHSAAALKSFTGPKPTTFRVNTLKSTPEATRERLTAQGFKLERVQWYRDAMILQDGRLRELQETEPYKTGAIYVQSLSSMLPPLVLEPKPGETVLDLTAAPGSKTTQLACLMEGRGRIVANDNNKIRFFKLRATVELQGARNVETTLRYGEAFGRELPETFDRVLADVPCSTEGRFDVSDPTSYKFWKPGKVREMARKQKRLIWSAVEALRPGGVLVYSTCTFAPEENEMVVHWALEKFKETLALEPIPLGLSNCLPGLVEWEGKALHPSLKLTRRIVPTEEMEGFFVARLRKHLKPTQQ